MGWNLQSGQSFKHCRIILLANKRWGKFFGKVGSFEEGYEFDALIIDDSSLQTFKSLSIEEPKLY